MSRIENCTKEFENCARCGKLDRVRDIVGGLCMGCRGAYTLPEDEWNEMTAGQKADARAAGIHCEVPHLSEDEREYRRQRSSQYEGPG